MCDSLSLTLHVCLTVIIFSAVLGVNVTHCHLVLNFTECKFSIIFLHTLIFHFYRRVLGPDREMRLQYVYDGEWKFANHIECSVVLLCK